MIKDFTGQHAVNIAAIIGGTICLSMLFYAMSVPTIPGPPEMPQPQTASQEVIACLKEIHQNQRASLAISDETNIIKSCTDNILRVSPAQTVSVVNKAPDSMNGFDLNQKVLTPIPQEDKYSTP